MASSSTAYALTQTSYDAMGRPECVAQRMNSSEFATNSLPSDACTPDTAGGYGDDRIARNLRTSDSYAWAGHYAVNRSYTANGLNQYTAAGSATPSYDARGNPTSTGSGSYGYTTENFLTTGPGGAGPAGGPLGAAREVSA